MLKENVADERQIAPKTSAKYQYLAAIVVNLLMIGHGVAGGWSSPIVVLLTSDESPLPSGKITMSEASWIASLMSIGGLVGNAIFGFVTNVYGRKLPLILITVPGIMSWLLILYAQNVYYLYAARIMNGFIGGGVFICIPLFLNEIASDRVRGVLGSTVMLSYNIGMLLAFALGSFFKYDITPKVTLAVYFVYVVFLFFLPESPSFLIKQNKITETEKSIRFYQNRRGKGNDYEYIQSEVEKLKKSITGEKETESDTSLKWSDVVQARKSMIIGIVLALLNQFSGCFAMLNYTASIFKEAGSAMDPNTSAIVVGVIQLIGSYAATFLVDRAGRKFLYVVSTIGTALGLATLGAYTMLKTWGYNVESFSWVPIASFSFVIFIASFAILTLPFLVISEVMPEKLKDFGQTLCMNFMWITTFIMVKLLPFITDSLGLHGAMFLFAVVCVLGAIFVLMYLPETKGKSYEQIMNSL